MYHDCLFIITHSVSVQFNVNLTNGPLAIAFKVFSGNIWTLCAISSILAGGALPVLCDELLSMTSARSTRPNNWISRKWHELTQSMKFARNLLWPEAATGVGCSALIPTWVSPGVTILHGSASRDRSFCWRRHSQWSCDSRASSSSFQSLLQ